VQTCALPISTRRGIRPHRPAPVDLPLRESLQHLRERDSALQPSERGAEAEVDAVPEGEVLGDGSMDVEGVRIRVTTFVSVRRAHQTKQSAAGGNLLTVDLDVTGDIARRVRGWWLEPQDLLDRVRDEQWVLDEL